jgi:hypothetical protein
MALTHKTDNQGTKENLYPEKLAWFKQNEKPEVVLLLADEPERFKLVIAWTNVQTSVANDLTELNDASENKTWEWLWENTIYSLSELKDKTGVSFSPLVLENKMRLLIGNRIIYPDSTMNSYVQRFLRGKVVTLFDNNVRNKTRKTG